MNKEIKIITLGDIFDNIETEEKAFRFKYYIKDLQQKVEQLKKENKKLKEENKRIFQNVNDDELLISNAMNYAELKKAEKKVEQLENIRKEAIELINKNSQYPTYYLTGNIAKDLLNILNKGE